jgi:hypothetical protein
MPHHVAVRAPLSDGMVLRCPSCRHEFSLRVAQRTPLTTGRSYSLAPSSAVSSPTGGASSRKLPSFPQKSTKQQVKRRKRKTFAAKAFDSSGTLALVLLLSAILLASTAYVWPLSDRIASSDWLASSAPPLSDWPFSGPLAAMTASAGGALTLFGLIFVATRTAIHRTLFWYKTTYGKPAVILGTLMCLVGIPLITFSVPNVRIYLRDTARMRQWEQVHANRKAADVDSSARQSTDVFKYAALAQEAMRESNPAARQRKMDELRALRARRRERDERVLSSSPSPSP